MTDKVKTIRLDTRMYKALREFQSEFFVKAGLEAIANAALAIGIDSLKQITSKQKILKSRAKRASRNSEA